MGQTVIEPSPPLPNSHPRHTYPILNCPKTTNKLVNKLTCPFCFETFSSSSNIDEINIHFKTCAFDHCQTDSKCIEFTSEETPHNKTDSEQIIKETNNSVLFNRLQYYLKNKKKIMEDKIPSTLSFEEKVKNLRASIKNKKVSWKDGFCKLEVTRQNLLYLSMKQFNKIDIYKELHIHFKGEISHDAGGLTREWFTMVVKLLEDTNKKLFIVSDSNEFSYTINPFLSENSINMEYFTFIGKLIAKALLENITLNLCFNKLIYKILLDEKITVDDLVFIDLELYRSFQNLKEMKPDVMKDLFLFYSVVMKDTNGKLHTFELIPNGNNVSVTDSNDYIQKRIDFITAIIYPFVEKIKMGLFSVLPKKEILEFTSNEFELILNGKPYIDVTEWEIFTKYKAPYNKSHQVIKWFWEILKELSEKQLCRLLQFCTGSARVPINGFRGLQSNRGNISVFTIGAISYEPGKINYIKAHTCFNRIEIPNYPSKYLLKDCIDFLVNNELLGFGID